jgi:hypothetical protein
LENIIEEADEEDSDDYSDDGLFAGINLKALKQRGKGKYYCPRGHRCDKGGVDKNGNLILFDRNSSFAYVTTYLTQLCGKPHYLSPVFLFHSHLQREMRERDALGRAQNAPASRFANTIFMQATLQQTSQALAVRCAWMPESSQEAPLCAP